MALSSAGGPLRLPALVDAFVSLDEPNAKRIHMSRIVLAIERALSSPEPLSPLDLIDLIEEGLGTPVQTVVKRVDEPAFTRRNGATPLFCEDAAGHVVAALAAKRCDGAHHVRIGHHESLNP